MNHLKSLYVTAFLLAAVVGLTVSILRADNYRVRPEPATVFGVLDRLAIV